jgi:hypothetical protein
MSDFVHYPGLLTPLRFENWFYFRLQMTKIQKTYSFGLYGSTAKLWLETTAVSFFIWHIFKQLSL